MPLAGSSIAAVGLVSVAPIAAERATPFVFTMTPTVSSAKVTGYGYYEIGGCDRTFEPVAGDRIEQAVGLRGTLGSFVSPRADVLRSAVCFSW